MRQLFGLAAVCLDDVNLLLPFRRGVTEKGEAFAIRRPGRVMPVPPIVGLSDTDLFELALARTKICQIEFRLRGW